MVGVSHGDGGGAAVAAVAAEAGAPRWSDLHGLIVWWDPHLDRLDHRRDVESQLEEGLHADHEDNRHDAEEHSGAGDAHGDSFGRLLRRVGDLMQYGGAVVRCCGVVVLWCCGGVAVWRCGVVVLWCCGGVMGWWCGVVCVRS